MGSKAVEMPDAMDAGRLRAVEAANAGDLARLERERYAAERNREREDSQRAAAVADAIAQTTRELDACLEQLLDGCPIYGGRVELRVHSYGDDAFQVSYRREYPGQGEYVVLYGYGPTPTAAILAAAMQSLEQDKERGASA